tara:strand:- start:1583 stop:2476 length:894 start_codon:yes stop_codon:yes gene_type:complete
MIAISQSGKNFFYLNWVASEVGPIVTKYGKIIKEINSIEDFKQKNYEIFSEIKSILKNEEPIFTYSLDKHNLIISHCYKDDNNPDLNSWYEMQYKDDNIDNVMDYYQYPISTSSYDLLSLGIPKLIRESIKDNILLLKARINNISAGIFSAEIGARYWFHADKLTSYLIWKVGKRKIDEILYIKNNQLESYFSITRAIKKNKINWQFGNHESTQLIYKYIESLIGDDRTLQQPIEKIFLYTCEEKTKDVKDIEKQDTENIVLLNPLSVLEKSEKEKFNIYATLYLAETGNAFGYVDV